MENIEFENLFIKYDPPAGGIQGLQVKLENLERKGPFLSIPKIAFAAAFIAAAFFALFFSLELQKPKRNLFVDLVNKSDNPVFIKYGYKKSAGEAVSIPENAKSHLAALHIETSDKNVKFYLIQSKM